MTNRFEKDYEDRVVVFLDLMGIRNFTLASENIELCDTYAIIDRFVSFTPGIPADPDEDRFTVNSQTLLQDSMTITSLSDSIIISLRKEYLIMLPFIAQQAAMFQSFLLVTKGIPVRGGIVSGKIFHEKNDPMTFGQGLVKAADLEEKEAKFPRVLVDGNLLIEYSVLYNSPDRTQETLSFFKNRYPTMSGFGLFFTKAAKIMKESITNDKLDNKPIVNFLERNVIMTYESQMKLNFIEQFRKHLQVIKENCPSGQDKDKMNAADKWIYLREKYPQIDDKTEVNVLDKWIYLEAMLESQTKSAT